MNLEKYLQRIQINSKPNPSLDSLQLLQKNHLLNIPFENLDIHFNRKIELEIPKIYDKIVDQKRGGFCYELNGLFFELLTEIGFSVQMISANVYSTSKKKYGIDFDHLALLVNLDGEEYLADVGFGEYTFYPLKLELDKIQKDERGDFFMDKISEDVFRVNKNENGEAVPQYKFKKTVWELKDYQSACDYQQFHPESHFRKKKVISRPIENGRITLAEDMLKIKKGDAIQESRIKSETDFQEKLLEYFGFRMVE